MFGLSTCRFCLGSFFFVWFVCLSDGFKFPFLPFVKLSGEFLNVIVSLTEHLPVCEALMIGCLFGKCSHCFSEKGLLLSKLVHYLVVVGVKVCHIRGFCPLRRLAKLSVYVGKVRKEGRAFDMDS